MQTRPQKHERTLRLRTNTPASKARWKRLLALTNLDPATSLDLAINIALVSLSKKPSPKTTTYPRMPKTQNPTHIGDILNSLETNGTHQHTLGQKTK